MESTSQLSPHHQPIWPVRSQRPAALPAPGLPGARVCGDSEHGAGRQARNRLGFSGEIGGNLEGSLNYGYSYCYIMIKGLKGILLVAELWVFRLLFLWLFWNESLRRRDQLTNSRFSQPKVCHRPTNFKKRSEMWNGVLKRSKGLWSNPQKDR